MTSVFAFDLKNISIKLPKRGHDFDFSYVSFSCTLYLVSPYCQIREMSLLFAIFLLFLPCMNFQSIENRERITLAGTQERARQGATKGEGRKSQPTFFAVSCQLLQRNRDILVKFF